jgi:hypothetical protein
MAPERAEFTSGPNPLLASVNRTSETSPGRPFGEAILEHSTIQALSNP